MLQGACFFALAAGKAGKAGHGRSEVAQTTAPQQQPQLGSQEAQAQDVVALVETSVQKVVAEVWRCAVQQQQQKQQHYAIDPVHCLGQM